MRATCWAPATAPSWERRQENLNAVARAACRSTLWENINCNKPAASSTNVKRSEFISCIRFIHCLNRIDRGVNNQKRTIFSVLHLISLGKTSRVLPAHLGDQRTNKSHKRDVLTDPAPPKVSTKTPWRIVSQAWWNVQFYRPCPASEAGC